MASQDPIDLLSLFASGKLTINIDGKPLVKLSADSKSLDVEGNRIKECGIPLGKVVELESGRGGVAGLVSGSRNSAKRLSDQGWKLDLYDEGDKLATLGRGTSRLLGHISANPTKVKRLLKMLK